MSCKNMSKVFLSLIWCAAVVMSAEAKVITFSLTVNCDVGGLFSLLLYKFLAAGGMIKFEYRYSLC